MATIFNSDLTKEITTGAKLQTGRDIIPSQLAEKVVPVMEVNPKLLRRCNILKTATATNATTATIYAVPAGRPFYLTAATLSMIKDATATSTSTRLIVNVDGVSARVLTIEGMTLTADTQTLTINFPFPIKVDAGSNITVTNTTNVANITSTGVIVGYHDDINNS